MLPQFGSLYGSMLSSLLSGALYSIPTPWDPQTNNSAWVFCVSWCAEFEWPVERSSSLEDRPFHCLSLTLHTVFVMQGPTYS